MKSLFLETGLSNIRSIHNYIKKWNIYNISQQRDYKLVDVF